MKIWKLLILAAFAAQIGMGVAHAEDATVYVVDVQRAISDSIVGKAAKNNMEAEVRKSEGRVAVVRAELDKMRAELEKQSALLSPDAVNEKRGSIENKERDLQREVQDQREALGQKNDNEMRKVISEIDTAIKEVAKDSKRAVIIEKDPRIVIYASDRLDITDEVIKRVDSKKL